MKFNTVTYNISFAILVVAAIYTLAYSGLTGLLVCSAVALIGASFLDQFEIIVAFAVLFAMIYIFFFKTVLKKFEPFQNTPITDRITTMKKDYKPNTTFEPMGIYASAIEGFEDVQPNVPKDGYSEKPSNAPTKPEQAEQADQPDQTKVDPTQAAKVASDVAKVMSKITKDKDTKDTEITGTTNELKNDTIIKDEFQSATNELFKLGKMPSEHTEGPMLDSGSTLLKAMGSFKPEQINAMSEDTKQLLETQKSLMGMLTQMRPVLADGKELLQTFSGMFGGNGAFKI